MTIFTRLSRERTIWPHECRDFFYYFGWTTIIVPQPEDGHLLSGTVASGIPDEDFDFEALAADVAPLLITKEQLKRVLKFKEFWEQVEIY
jgi:hypothetical protein